MGVSGRLMNAWKKFGDWATDAIGTAKTMHKTAKIGHGNFMVKAFDTTNLRTI